MDELKVIVEQKPGKVTWNFEELKAELSAVMSDYAVKVYDDNAISVAKSDVAYLRKFKKEIDKRRIEIKKMCLAPYATIEAQANELTKILDGPITLIDKQVKTYEEEQRQIRKKEILEYFAETFSDVSDDITTRVKFKYYDTKWENATASKKSWKDAISDLHEAVVGDIAVLDGVEEEFRDEAKKIYAKNVNLGEAMRYVQTMTEQKRRILEAEERRREAERRKAEEAEKARLEAEARKNIPAPVPVEPELTADQIKGHAIKADELNAGTIVAPVEPRNEPQKGIVRKLIVFEGTEEQFKKVVGYIRYTGAKCEVK